MNIKSINKFTGYENFRDITNQDPTAISAGSLNTFIPDGEKVEPRAGMAYLGDEGSQGVLITNSAIIFFTAVSGTFVNAEVITGGTSGATGTIGQANNNTAGLNNYSQLLVTGITGSFQTGETITGGTSGATGTITVILLSSDYWTIPNRIHSAYDNFINKEGIQVPLRVFFTGDITKGDSIEAWLPIYRGQIDYSTLVGTFQVGEIITGGTSGATAVIVSDMNSILSIDTIVGVFQIGETITGGTSGATAVIDLYNPSVASSNKAWFKINLTTPTNPLISTHRFYWSPWWDSVNLQSRVNFAFGAKGYTPSYNTNWIASWTGGIAQVVALTGTTITTDKPWVAKGFLTPPEGTSNIRVNGVSYTVTGNFDTDTITVGSTAGISIGDYVFQAINVDQMPGGGDTVSGVQEFGEANFTTADVIDTINNQVYYIDWKQRNVYISHNRNITATNSIRIEFDTPTGTFQIGDTVTGGTSGATGTVVAVYSGVLYFNATNNEFVIGETITGSPSGATGVVTNTTYPTIPNSPFTIFAGTGLDDANFFMNTVYTPTDKQNHTYKVVIDGTDTLSFFGLGLNDISFSGTSTNNEVATYKVIIDGLKITYNTLVGVFTVGEVVTGGISGAYGTIVTNGGGAMTIKTIAGVFQVGEGITGGTSGATANITALTDTFSWYLNDVLQSANVVITGASQSLSGGISLTFGATIGHTIDNYWTYEVYPGAGTQDTYSWYLDGVLKGARQPVDINPTSALSNFVYINFKNLKGHTVNDYWSVFAEARVFRGYQDFTYTAVNRLPGEGFTLSLDSNGWTMKPQENVMLINAQAGHYYNVQLKLSSDLKSESVVIERLKSEPQNKTLYPYLIGYIKNQLASISQDKTYDVLGRQKFLELQQTKSISDKVRIDFETADWEDADIRYFKRKIFFNLPKMGLMFVYDDYKKYWHSPMQFGKRISLLAIIDDKLVGHSYEQNESYELFTGLNDLGVFPIKTRIVFPYMSFGKRLTKKVMNFIGFEGYILGKPEIRYTINAGLGGCEGQKNGIIAPENTPAGLCLPIDTASLGKSSLGFHGLGNSPSDVIPHFFYIKPFDDMTFYLRNVEVACDSLEQRWSLISWGTDANDASISSADITDET